MRPKLKILHTEWSTGWGGQEIRIHGEALALRALGHEVHFACRPISTIHHQARNSGFVVHDVEFNHSMNPFTVFKIVQLLQKEAFDVIHTHSSIDSWCGAFAGRLSGTPIIRSRHLASKIKRDWTSNLLYSRMPAIVLTSGEAIRQHLLENARCREERVISVPAGADHGRFRPEPVRDRIRDELGISKELPLIGIVAVLRSWKGHEILLDAFALLLFRGLKAQLLIVGDGPIRKNLEEKIRSLSLEQDVFMAGYRTDVPSIMNALDVLVLPSLKNEATSQVIPQAMLCEIPVVASTAGGLTEIVRDGVTGLSVSPGDVPALAQALSRILQDRTATEKMVANGKELALREFTFAGMIQKTVDAYYQAIALCQNS